MKKQNKYTSWGRYPTVGQEAKPLFWRHLPLDIPSDAHSVLPYGLGRSYGDSCLNENGIIFLCRNLNRMMDFNSNSGILRAEAGLSLDEIINFFLPRGWFLPVTPGTRYVTLGGAVANDVHGKNHHIDGSFGHHVRAFELLRSDGERIICSREQNKDWFCATIGGLGLTGLITWVEIELIPVSGPMIDAESYKFRNLDEFFDLSNKFSGKYKYLVAWIDCLTGGSELGRGILYCGNHSESTATRHMKNASTLSNLKSIPFDLPGCTVNSFTVGLFNNLYYSSHKVNSLKKLVYYDNFFYPLDNIHNWNRMYGKGGFLQWQCVIPLQNSISIIRTIIEKINRSKQGSFLAVLKAFGDIKSLGMLSFPRQGVTLALDFPIKGDRTFRLLDELDLMVREAGGVIYPAKDARMAPENFQFFYPEWESFSNFIDPRFSSSFWRRVTNQQGTGKK